MFQVYGICVLPSPNFCYQEANCHLIRRVLGQLFFFISIAKLWKLARQKKIADVDDKNLLKKKKQLINISNMLNEKKTKPQRPLGKSTAGVKQQSVTEVHNVFF